MTIKEYVAQRKLELKEEISHLKIKPHIQIIQINDDPASNAYVKGKLKDAAEMGIDAELLKLPQEETTPEKLQEIIENSNNNPSIDGFIVQMPLPSQINEETVKLAVDPKKDVDGFHPLSSLAPCTPKGIMTYLPDRGQTERLNRYLYDCLCGWCCRHRSRHAGMGWP